MDSRTCGLNSCSSRALLECGLSSCGTQASIPCGMWDLPGLGIEPKSHALAGSFLITGPQGKSEVAQSCLTLCDPRDCSLPGSSVHGIFQARVLEWVAISFSRGSSQPRDWALASHIAGKCFIHKAQAFFFFFPLFPCRSVTVSCLTVTPWTAALQASLSFLEFAQTRVHWVSDTIQPSRSLLLPSPPAFNLSQHQGLSQCVSSSHQVAKVLELQYQAPSALTSFRTDWFDLLAVQGTLKRLLQHYNLKA